jgi:hypothetical protein
MILYRWQGQARNFGDELNTELWPRLLPDFFDDDAGTVFLGIGSILDGRHTTRARKLVVGSGYGGYEGPPRLDSSWVISWVRGPRTAHMLGLPPETGLGDPASLLPFAGLVDAGTDTGADTRRAGAYRPIGFMPHFESAAHGAWRAASRAAGLRLIDPRDDPAAITAAITGCRLLLSEALHGVIVADALRIPWIAIEPLAPVHRPKWHDWADTLDLRIVFRRLPSSTLLQAAHTSTLANYHLGRRLLARHGERLRCIGGARFLAAAVSALEAAAQATPQLSAAGALERSQIRMLDQVARLKAGARHAATRRVPPCNMTRISRTTPA